MSWPFGIKEAQKYKDEMREFYHSEYGLEEGCISLIQTQWKFFKEEKILVVVFEKIFMIGMKTKIFEYVAVYKPHTVAKVVLFSKIFEKEHNIVNSDNSACVTHLGEIRSIDDRGNFKIMVDKNGLKNISVLFKLE